MLDLSTYRKESLDNLTLLADELALNHLDASTIDLFDDQEPKDKKSPEYVKYKEEREKRIKTLQAKVLITPPEGQPTYRRNVLVIGAGCTFNAFHDVPLGNQAIIEIQKQITVFNDPQNQIHISFEDLRQYLIDEVYGDAEKSAVVEQPKQPSPEHSPEKNARIVLDNIFKTKEGRASHHLLKELGAKYYSELQKLRLYSREFAKEKNDLDFETSLNLLTKILPLSTVRDIIQKIFNHRHGPSLHHELIAHLFKNRFIDVIINFNFDEFLDQALDDELGKNGYDSILSDGDCQPIAEIVHNGRLRQPLYIKPHGTASHKSTMRFTKDQYYETPLDMRNFLKDVLSVNSESDKQLKKNVNLITVGFEMNSLEFEEILKDSLSVHSRIFSLYHHEKTRVYNDKLSSSDCFPSIYRTEYLHKKLTSHNVGLLKENIHPIGHEFFTGPDFEEVPKKPDPDRAGIQETEEGKIALTPNTPSLGNTFNLLFETVRQKFKFHFRPQRSCRHQLISELFGTKDFYKTVYEQAEKDKMASIIAAYNGNIAKGECYPYPKSYFNSSDYFKDRVLIEMLISLASNNGKLDSPLLMRGKLGFYYAEHQKKIDETPAPQTDGSEHMGKLMQFILQPERQTYDQDMDTLSVQTNSEGVREYVKEIKMVAHNDKISKDELQRIKKRLLGETEGGNSLFSAKFRKFLSSLSDQDFMNRVLRHFIEALRINKSRITSEFRNTIHHVFDNYRTTNLLNTDLAVDLNFHESLTQGNITQIRMVAEYGNQLSKFLKVIRKEKIQVELILADTFDLSEEQQRAEPIVRSIDRLRSDTQGMCKLLLKTALDENIDLSEKLHATHKLKCEIAKYLIFKKSQSLHQIPGQQMWPIDKLRKYESECFRAFNEMDLKILFLPINGHNHHMTIFVNHDETFDRAIYYYKRGLDLTINPIRLLIQANIRRINKKFDNYWKKAEEYHQPEIYAYFQGLRDQQDQAKTG